LRALYQREHVIQTATCPIGRRDRCHASHR
jgi:hypothetical protein